MKTRLEKLIENTRMDKRAKAIASIFESLSNIQAIHTNAINFFYQLRSLGFHSYDPLITEVNFKVMQNVLYCEFETIEYLQGALVDELLKVTIVPVIAKRYQKLIRCSIKSYQTSESVSDLNNFVNLVDMHTTVHNLLIFYSSTIHVCMATPLVKYFWLQKKDTYPKKLDQFLPIFRVSLHQLEIEAFNNFEKLSRRFPLGKSILGLKHLELDDKFPDFPPYQSVYHSYFNIQTCSLKISNMYEGVVAKNHYNAELKTKAQFTYQKEIIDRLVHSIEKDGRDSIKLAVSLSHEYIKEFLPNERIIIPTNEELRLVEEADETTECVDSIDAFFQGSLKISKARFAKLLGGTRFNIKLYEPFFKLIDRMQKEEHFNGADKRLPVSLALELQAIVGNFFYVLSETLYKFGRDLTETTATATLTSTTTTSTSTAAEGKTETPSTFVQEPSTTIIVTPCPTTRASVLKGIYSATKITTSGNKVTFAKPEVYQRLTRSLSKNAISGNTITAAAVAQVMAELNASTSASSPEAVPSTSGISPAPSTSSQGLISIIKPSQVPKPATIARIIAKPCSDPYKTVTIVSESSATLPENLAKVTIVTKSRASSPDPIIQPLISPTFQGPVATANKISAALNALRQNARLTAAAARQSAKKFPSIIPTRTLIRMRRPPASRPATTTRPTPTSRLNSGLKRPSATNTANSTAVSTVNTATGVANTTTNTIISTTSTVSTTASIKSTATSFKSTTSNTITTICTTTSTASTATRPASILIAPKGVIRPSYPPFIAPAGSLRSILLPANAMGQQFLLPNQISTVTSTATISSPRIAKLIPLNPSMQVLPKGTSSLGNLTAGSSLLIPRQTSNFPVFSFMPSLSSLTPQTIGPQPPPRPCIVPSGSSTFGNLVTSNTFAFAAINPLTLAPTPVLLNSYTVTTMGPPPLIRPSATFVSSNVGSLSLASPYVSFTPSSTPVICSMGPFAGRILPNANLPMPKLLPLNRSAPPPAKKTAVSAPVPKTIVPKSTPGASRSNTQNPSSSRGTFPSTRPTITSTSSVCNLGKMTSSTYVITSITPAVSSSSLKTVMSSSIKSPIDPPTSLANIPTYIPTDIPNFTLGNLPGNTFLIKPVTSPSYTVTSTSNIYSLRNVPPTTTLTSTTAPVPMLYSAIPTKYSQVVKQEGGMAAAPPKLMAFPISQPKNPEIKIETKTISDSSSNHTNNTCICVDDSPSSTKFSNSSWEDMENTMTSSPPHQVPQTSPLTISGNASLETYPTTKQNNTPFWSTATPSTSNMADVGNTYVIASSDDEDRPKSRTSSYVNLSDSSYSTLSLPELAQNNPPSNLAISPTNFENYTVGSMPSSSNSPQYIETNGKSKCSIYRFNEQGKIVPSSLPPPIVADCSTDSNASILAISSSTDESISID